MRDDMPLPSKTWLPEESIELDQHEYTDPNSIAHDIIVLLCVSVVSGAAGAFVMTLFELHLCNV